MNNANKPCFCDSGKKYKKCHLNSKKRVSAITYNFGETKSVDNIQVNCLTGELIFHSKGEKLEYKSVQYDVGFERSKNKKIWVYGSK